MNVADVRVAQVMSRTLVAVEPDESPLMAWEIMRRANVHHLPVVESNGRLRGVLTREDLTGRWSGGPIEQSRVRVGALVAGRRCPHVPMEACLADAAAAMIGAGVDAVPVLGNAAVLVGMVTTTDVLRAVAERLTGREEEADLKPGSERAPELMTGVFRLVPVLPGGESGE